jgi:cytidine deaminase
MCRQVLREFLHLRTPILLVPGDYLSRAQRADGTGVVTRTLEELLPDSFGPEHLELPRDGLQK